MEIIFDLLKVINHALQNDCDLQFLKMIKILIKFSEAFKENFVKFSEFNNLQNMINYLLIFI